MSITVSTCSEICNSPLNQSKAKMLYSFSKEDRFKRMKKQLCDRFYDLPSAQSSRAASFGYGTKSDFTKTASKNPPPNSYNIRGIVEDAKKSRSGFGFGEGREEMQSTGPLAMVRLNKNPGPGSYELGDTLNKGSYSLRPRTHDSHSDRTRSPGPGTYPTSFGINKIGNYFLSKFKSSGVSTFNPTSSARFKHSLNKIPGPGSYQSLGNIHPDGKYFNSKFKCSLVRSFGQQDRNSLNNRSETPGPGNYKLPSEFGHYIARSADKQNL